MRPYLDITVDIYSKVWNGRSWGLVALHIHYMKFMLIFGNFTLKLRFLTLYHKLSQHCISWVGVDNYCSTLQPLVQCCGVCNAVNTTAAAARVGVY